MFTGRMSRRATQRRLWPTLGHMTDAIFSRSGSPGRLQSDSNSPAARSPNSTTSQEFRSLVRGGGQGPYGRPHNRQGAAPNLEASVAQLAEGAGSARRFTMAPPPSGGTTEAEPGGGRAPRAPSADGLLNASEWCDPFMRFVAHAAGGLGR
jgi:hypothetical protein